MGIEFRNKNGYKEIINSLIITSGITFDRALDLLIDEIDTYQIENYIELIVDKISNKEEK